MPREIRYISFTTDEFLQAARLYFRRVGEPLPGTIEAVSVVDDSRIRLSLVQTAPRTAAGGDSEMFLDHNKIGSILVFYCIEQGIPLPSKSLRTLKLFGGNICLMVTKNIPAADLDRIKLDLPD